MAVFMAEHRRPLTEEMLAISPWCEVCPKIVLVDPGWLRRLGRLDDHGRVRDHHADALHELRKSGQGGSKLNRANLLRSCNLGNGWVEDNPLLARAAGLVVIRGDLAYASLGADQDGER